MAGQLKEVRNRIKSVQNTQQITKAMKMVSAAKLRKAQDNIVQMRPYARKLQEVGTVTVMPLGSPIGSGQGTPSFESIRIIVEQARVPVVVDAGLGVPSDAAQALEIGADATLVNTAIAKASKPALMGEAPRPRAGEAREASPSEGPEAPWSAGPPSPPTRARSTSWSWSGAPPGTPRPMPSSCSSRSARSSRS